MAQRALLQRRMQRTSHAAPRRLASGQLLARTSLQAALRLCQERLLAKRIVTTCPSPLHRHSPEQKIGARPAQCARVDTYAQSTRSPEPDPIAEVGGWPRREEKDELRHVCKLFLAWLCVPECDGTPSATVDPLYGLHVSRIPSAG